jgi:hypothetical protein
LSSDDNWSHDARLLSIALVLSSAVRKADGSSASELRLCQRLIDPGRIGGATGGAFANLAFDNLVNGLCCGVATRRGATGSTDTLIGSNVLLLAVGFLGPSAAAGMSDWS